MSDEAVYDDGSRITARYMSLVSGALPSSHRRWVIRYALLFTAAVNLAINSSLAWLTTIATVI